MIQSQKYKLSPETHKIKMQKPILPNTTASPRSISLHPHRANPLHTAPHPRRSNLHKQTNQARRRAARRPATLVHLVPAPRRAATRAAPPPATPTRAARRARPSRACPRRRRGTGRRERERHPQRGRHGVPSGRKHASLGLHARAVAMWRRQNRAQLGQGARIGCDGNSARAGDKRSSRELCKPDRRVLQACSRSWCAARAARRGAGLRMRSLLLLAKFVLFVWSFAGEFWSLSFLVLVCLDAVLWSWCALKLSGRIV